MSFLLSCSDFWEEALELATYLTAYPPTISPSVWSTWPGVMSIVRSEGGIDFFDSKYLPSSGEETRCEEPVNACSGIEFHRSVVLCWVDMERCYAI